MLESKERLGSPLQTIHDGGVDLRLTPDPSGHWEIQQSVTGL